MDRLERFTTLHRLLTGRRVPISKQALMAELEMSESTVKRTIKEMRLYLGAPINYDHERNGYLYQGESREHFELPGLWFNQDELFALLTTHMLLSGIQPGLLDDYLKPFQKRIEELLPKLVRQVGRHSANQPEKLDFEQISKRVRILQQATRPVDVEQFRQLVGALVRRQRLKILYHGRARDKQTERVISPQRLIYYRDNWYVDAWCHERDGLRSFSLDRLRPVRYEEGACQEIPDQELDAHFGAAYGIFAGAPKAVAHLRFSSQAAKWVADEHWHPDQTLTVLEDGRCDLTVPYSDERELMLDILKYGPEVEVISPTELRGRVAERLRRAAEIYARS